MAGLGEARRGEARRGEASIQLGKMKRIAEAEGEGENEEAISLITRLLVGKIKFAFYKA